MKAKNNDGKIDIQAENWDEFLNSLYASLKLIPIGKTVEMNVDGETRKFKRIM